MAYIGPLPAETFTSFATQEFSTSATTSYTLDHPVTNENELALFINNVRQQPGSGKAYTASGTALTLSAATASTDTMYAVFLGRALQTVNPADASVGTSQLAATSVTAAKLNNDIISGTTALAEAPADTDEFLVSDGGTLKRIDYSYIKSSPTHTLLSTNTISGATSSVAFTSTQITSTYRDYLITGSEIDQDTDSATLRFFMSTDNGSSYETSNNRYVSKGYADNGGDSSAQSGGDNRFEITTTGSTESVGRTFSFRLYLHNPLGTTSRTFYHSNGVFHQVNDRVIPFYGGGYVNTTSAINNVKFEMSSGNFDLGVFKIYGIT